MIWHPVWKLKHAGLDEVAIIRDFKTKIHTIAVTTECSGLSQQVAQSLVHLLDECMEAKAQTWGGAKAEFTERRLQVVRQEMVQAEGTFRVFLHGNRNYLLSPDPSVRQRCIRLDNELKLRTQIAASLSIANGKTLLQKRNDLPILNLLDTGNRRSRRLDRVKGNESSRCRCWLESRPCSANIRLGSSMYPGAREQRRPR